MIILWTYAIAGFFAGAHIEFFSYPDIEACERARHAVEKAMAAHGYSGIRTACQGQIA